MAYSIDDDENRIQDMQAKLDELAVQTFSPEVVARNESTRNTGIQTGDGAVGNPYPLWMPIRNFGTIGNITLDILLNRVDGHVAKMTLNGDTDFAFSSPPGTDKMMQFVLDVTIDGTGGYTINLPGNLEPGTITINNTANARTILKIQTTDGAVTYQAQDILTTGGGSAGYDTIQEGGASKTQRSIMNFIGATVVDCPGNNRTDITITAGASGTLSALTIDVIKDWQAFGITNLGKLSMVGDIDLVTQNIINIDQARFVNDSGAVGTATDSVILVNSSNQFQFNTAQANSIAFSLEKITAVTIKHDGTALTRTLSVLSDSTNTASIAQLNITRNFATGVTGQEIGKLGFLSPSDAGGSFEYSSIIGKIEDATAASIDGSLKFNATVNNAITTFMTINDGGNGLVVFQKPVSSETITPRNVGDTVGETNDKWANIFSTRFTMTTSALTGLTATEQIIIGHKDAMKFNVPTGDTLLFHINAVPQFEIKAGNAVLFDDVSFATMNLQRTTLSLPNGSPISQVHFQGNTISATKSIVSYASIEAIATDTTDGAAAVGELNLAVTEAGDTLLVDYLRVSADTSTIDMLRPIQFTEITKPTNPGSDDGLIYVRDTGGISTPFFLDSAGTETSMIASATIGNTIFQGDSSVTVLDPTGSINFVTNNIPVGNISNALGLIINVGSLTINDSSAKISLNNGFFIENTNSTNTTFSIPNDEILLIKEGSDTRIQIDKNITLNADSSDDIIFQEGGTTVGKYDGGTDDWKFNPSDDFIVDAGGEILFETDSSSRLRIQNTEVRFFTQLTMDGVNQIKFATSTNSASSGFVSSPGNFAGFLLAKGPSGDIRIPFFNT